ncbi:MAG: 5-oxoprolinase subunit PxpB [Bacillota bacterium]
MPVYAKPRYLVAGDSSLVVELGEGIDPAVNRRVQGLARLIREHGPAGVVEVIPSYRSVLVYYRPWELPPHALLGWLARLEVWEPDPAPSRLVRIPVAYGGEFGPDLEEIARFSRLSPEEVVAIHAGQEYMVYCLGFAPGFPFLGKVPPEIAMPRLATPRTRVPAGSVGIAGEQTGIYPSESPGGWRLLGRTPLSLFVPRRDPPALLQPGDRVRLQPISAEEFREWQERAQRCGPEELWGGLVEEGREEGSGSPWD